MRHNFLFYWGFILSACALLAIGRVYDERLTIATINLVIPISVIYLLSVIFILFSIKSISLSKSKMFLYLFYFLILGTTPILWLFFGTTEHGIERFLNFCLIIVPLSIVVVERYNRQDALNTLYILFGVSCFLALLAILGLSLSERVDGRLAILGGGPIIFGRWMGFGILSAFLLPLKIKNRYRYILMIIFLLLALASGSRGPILALFLTVLFYIGLNFNRVIIRILLWSLSLSLVFVFSGIASQMSDIGKLDRVFMNFSSTGLKKKSTSTRQVLAKGSLNLLEHYPLGVGTGNWQKVSNQIAPNSLMPLEYPHNLFLEVACENGLQTALLLLILFVYVLHLSYHKMIQYRRDKTSLYPLLFFLFLFLFFNCLVSGMLNDSRLLFIVISLIIAHRPFIALQDNKTSSNHAI